MSGDKNSKGADLPPRLLRSIVSLSTFAQAVPAVKKHGAQIAHQVGG